jgi:membrane protein DedA with SNARE-associated domain
MVLLKLNSNKSIRQEAIMNSVIGFILSAAIGGADAPVKIINSDRVLDIIVVCILGFIFIGLITIFIYKKRNKK